MSFHTDDAFCPGCTTILRGCHADVEYWFYRGKDAKKDLHLSDGFRNQVQQEDCNKRGTSKEIWPHSKHNREDENGKPRSEAMDCMRMGADGKMYWEVEYFRELAHLFADLDAPIKWGGEFHHPDNPHFEMVSKG